MFDRDLVTSGFDTETVVSEGYLTYLLLAQVEAGLLPLQFDVDDPQAGVNLSVTLHPPDDYARRYEPEASAPLPDPVFGSFAIELLPEGAEAFMHLTVFVTVVDNTSGRSFGPLPAGLLINLDLVAQTSGVLEQGHQLRLTLVRLDDATSAALTAVGADPSSIEDAVRSQLDRAVPLGVAQGQQVQQIRMRKLVAEGQRSLGLYVNLALRSGPEPDALRAPRGDVAQAQDFREPASPIAFATSPGLFALLGPDVKFRQAEETSPGSGEFRFPLRKDPLDPDSDEIGKIKGISVGPELLFAPNQPPTPSGRLMIDVHGEYTDALGDPDFHLQLFFRPKIEDGIVEWDLDVDVDLGLLATLLLIAVGIGLTLLFGPGLGWGSTLLVGTIIGLAVLKGLVAEPLAAKLIEDRLDEESQASFLDALPFRVPAARRRWDPFYTTDHQVVALVDAVTVDTLGIAFAGIGVTLDKQPEPVSHVVIRDEERASDGDIAAFRYRVSDFQNILTDLAANGPGRDRMDFTRSDPLGEPTLVSLSDEQIAERIAHNRILAPITYTPERIYVVGHEIDGLLCLSRRERSEERRRLIDEFRRTTKAALRAQAIADLTQELGRPPTDAEVEARLEALANERQPAFEENELPAQLADAVARVLRFDLAPEEMVARQLAGMLLLDGKEIITRHNRNGTITPYFRDRPDGNRRDNLLSLPHYTPPYQPPA